MKSGARTYGVILQHDNARPHTANMIKMALQELGWEVLPHPPYSPDVAPSDYHLFRSLSNALSGVTFENAAALQIWLDQFFASKPPIFFKRGIEKLPGQLRRLRARIAQLERQQTINSPISSASFDLLAQNGNDAADTLGDQNDEIKPNNDKQSKAKHEEEQTKFDQLEPLREKIKQIELELKGIKQLRGGQIMEEYQNKQQQTIIDAFIEKLTGMVGIPKFFVVVGSHP
uniref:Transposase n=1 Tax=Globodera rostochiensis TaxID=31243 RepID=A0A914H9D1_GLORO